MTRRTQKNVVSAGSVCDNGAATSASGLNARVNSIEEALKTGIEDLKSQFLTSGTAPETLKSISDKLEEFKNSTLQSLQGIRDELLRLEEKTRAVDAKMEDRMMEHLQSSLVIYGVEEKTNEDPIDTVCQIINSKLLNHSNNEIVISKTNINYCQRLGKNDAGSKKPRPLSVEFTNRWIREEVFALKRHLKGSSIVVAERLIKSRLELYNQARAKLGIKSCWTLNGRIYVSVGDVKRRLISKSDLDVIS